MSRFSLTINADSVEELYATCRELGGEDARVVGSPADTPPVGEPPRAFEPDDSEPVTEAPSDSAEPPAVDATGLPHDERIHASSKALNADGTWRKRRGVDDETVTSVEAELRGVEPANKPDTLEPVAVPQAAPEQAAPATEPGVLPAPSVTMKLLSSLMQSGKANPTYLKELSAHAGIANVTGILSSDEAHQAVREKLAQDGMV
jgi:hypothetical protein